MKDSSPTPSPDESLAVKLNEIRKTVIETNNPNTSRQDELMKDRILNFCRRNQSKKKMKELIEFDLNISDTELWEKIDALNDNLLGDLLTIFAPTMKYKLNTQWRKLDKPLNQKKAVGNLMQRDSLNTYLGKVMKMFPSRKIVKENSAFTTFCSIYNSLMVKNRADAPKLTTSMPLAKEQLLHLRKSCDLDTPKGLNHCDYLTFTVAGGLRNAEIQEKQKINRAFFPIVEQCVFPFFFISAKM